VAQFLLPISELAVAQYLGADFRIGSSKAFGYRFQNRQRHSLELPISESVAVKLLATDF
jgi:hypothetical protein